MSGPFTSLPVDAGVPATTGIGSPLAWQIVSLLALLCALVVLLRWWMQNRRR